MTAPTDTGLSKEEYIKQGDAICAESDRKTDAIPQPPADAPRQAILLYAQQLVNTARPDIERFRALKGPVADRPTTDQMSAYADALLAKQTEGLRAMTLGDGTAYVAAMEQADAAGLQFRRTTANYGFAECPKQ